MALFGITAKRWREEHSNLEGNIRDYASINELICLANLENLNSVFINDKIAQSIRLEKLNKIAWWTVWEAGIRRDSPELQKYRFCWRQKTFLTNEVAQQSNSLDVSSLSSKVSNKWLNDFWSFFQLQIWLFPILWSLSLPKITISSAGNGVKTGMKIWPQTMVLLPALPGDEQSPDCWP